MTQQYPKFNKKSVEPPSAEWPEKNDLLTTPQVEEMTRPQSGSIHRWGCPKTTCKMLMILEKQHRGCTLAMLHMLTRLHLDNFGQGETQRIGPVRCPWEVARGNIENVTNPPATLPQPKLHPPVRHPSTAPSNIIQPSQPQHCVRHPPWQPGAELLGPQCFPGSDMPRPPRAAQGTWEAPPSCRGPATRALAPHAARASLSLGSWVPGFSGGA